MIGCPRGGHTRSLRHHQAFFVMVVALGGLAAPSTAKPAKLYPVDTARRDPSFLRFRQNLLRAALRHDYEAIVHVLDPEVTSSFGDEETIPAFHRFWKDNRPELYRELETVLRLGGSFSEHGRVFSAPYVWSEWDKHGLGEGLEAGAVIAPRVPLRKSPSAGSPVLAWLSYDLLPQMQYPPVKEQTRGGTRRWTRVKTAGGKRGYVETRYARSVIDYRAVFTKKRGRWVMTVFVAGD